VLGAFEGKVRHILISWKGKTDVVALKDPERTEEQAWKLANDLVNRANSGEDFIELQKKHNEDDSDPTRVYDVSPTAQMVKPFLRLASELKVDEVGIVESQFGIHVIKRIE
jgi:parvulin-like peptidyl-prolyl isomerase